jgi:hypothetical protein
MTHSWAKATVHHTPAPDQGCAWCSLPANAPDAATTPCVPSPPTVEGEAFARRAMLDRVRALAGNRPYPASMMAGEIEHHRKRLHAWLDEHDLAGSEYDDRVNR